MKQLVWTITAALALTLAAGCGPERRSGGGGGGGAEGEGEGSAEGEGEGSAEGEGEGPAEGEGEGPAEGEGEGEGEGPAEGEGEGPAEGEGDVASCPYPHNNRTIAFNRALPQLSWEGAYWTDGEQVDLDMGEVACGPGWDGVQSIIIVVYAEWCTQCPAYMENLLQQADSLEAAGSLLLMVMAEDGAGQPARNRDSSSYQQSHRYEGRALWAGDADTRPSPGAVRSSSLVEGYPSALVVRTSDMKLITHQGLSEYVLPFVQIVNHIDADWSNPMQPDLPSTCDEAEEEESEPNNDPRQAAELGPGSVDGGVCDRTPDFYRLESEGRWQVDLEFSHAMGDLDVYVVDEGTGEVAVDRSGNPIGSESTDDNESFSHRGPATIFVVGYQGATATYRLTLTELE